MEVMSDSPDSSIGYEDLYTCTGERREKIKKKSESEIKVGLLTRYILKSDSETLIQDVKRKTTGDKENSKPHKTILMVGATGTGKSTLINAFINYMLGVEFRDRIWCEIIETKENQTDSQTNTVTLYDVYAEECPFSLTVIGVHKIDVVCLVVSAANVRLTQEQLYVFDAILSLFGKDMEKNITVLMTRSPKKPINAIKAIKASNVKCARSDDGEPLYFRFDFSYCEAMNENLKDEEYEEEYKGSWNLSQKSMKSFLDFLGKVQTIDVKLTLSVLRNRKQLISSINNCKEQIIEKEKQKTELEQTKKAVEKFAEKKDFTFEVDEPYKVKVPIEYEWWHMGSKEATCCRKCKENCHFPGCWSVKDLSWCSMMSNGKCTVCTGKCSFTEHVKESKIYVQKTRKVTKTSEYLKKKYEEQLGKTLSLKSCLEKDIEKNEKEKARLVEECYKCVLNLEDVALKSETVATLVHLDFLIEKMRETNNTDKVKRLEGIKKKCEDACKGLLDCVILSVYK